MAMEIHFEWEQSNSLWLSIEDKIVNFMLHCSWFFILSFIAFLSITMYTQYTMNRTYIEVQIIMPISELFPLLYLLLFCS